VIRIWILVAEMGKPLSKCIRLVSW